MVAMHTFDWDGKPVPRLGFGCASVMGRVGRNDSLHAMNAAWEQGVRLFDTARSYGYGAAEGLLGEFLSGRRAQAVVITKFGILPQRPAAWKLFAKPMVRAVLRMAPAARSIVRGSLATEASPGHFDVKTMRASLEESLRQLRTDHVDALLAHEAPAGIMAQDDLMAALKDLVDEGKVRRAGIACSMQVASVVDTQGPFLLSVLQFPATEFILSPPNFSPARFRIANHPFGGTVFAKSLVQLFATSAGDLSIGAVLRGKMLGDPNERVAEFCFARATRNSQPHAIVTSMLQPNHLRANIAAIDSKRFTAEDILAIERYISANRLRD
jgi:aryl-alcohol dehydrogenase-like predicted oxidoreductase